MSAVPVPLAQLRLGTARDLLERAGPKDEEVLPLTLPPLRRLLPGGLVRGELSEVTGELSSGRFSLILACLAAATSTGEATALVDLGDHFDPQEASRGGVVLERLLWLRPTRLRQALAATEMAISGGFPLVVLELGIPPVRGGRGTQSSWRRLAAAARNHRCALLVSSPQRACAAAAATVLGVGRGKASWHGKRAACRLLEGLGGRVRLDKKRGEIPGASAELALHARYGAVGHPTSDLGRTHDS